MDFRNNIAFSKGTPSLFYISSPFQALCAIEAIHEFEIDDFLFFVFLFGDNCSRDRQIIELLEENNFTYNCYKFGELPSWSQRIKTLCPHNGKYKRAFIGHYKNLFFYLYSFLEISNGGTLVLLDDGTATIPFLKGYYIQEKSFSLILLKVSSLIRRISFNKYIYTLYGRISHDSLYIYLNEFKYLSSLCVSNKQDKGVVFVGTDPNAYSSAFNLSKDQFKIFLKEQLIWFSKEFKSYKLFFVAHGCDNTIYTKQFCDIMNIEYVKPNVSVELFLMKQKWVPITCVGFTSSALFNIKKLFPGCNVINILYSEINTSYNTISDFYQTNNIPSIIIHK